MANNVSTEAVAAALVVALLASPALGGERTPAGAMTAIVGASERVVADPHSGLAVGGFDPVSYFLGAPRPGEAGREVIYKGAVWRFAGEANREAFRRDPESYAPRIGGHDPVAMAQGRPAAGDAAFFAVVDERLYLFRDETSRQRFLAETDLAPQAEARWRAIEARLAGE